MWAVIPDGKPILRCLDAFMWAKECGKELDFVDSYGKLVWGYGVDAGNLSPHNSLSIFFLNITQYQFLEISCCNIFEITI